MPLNCTSAAGGVRRRLNGVSDPYFSSVVYLNHCNGTNGQTTFTDNSSYARTITTNGSAQVSTTSPKYGTGALLTAGTSDFLTCAGSANFDFGTGDFCVESWIKKTDSTAYGALFHCNAGYAGWSILADATGTKILASVFDGASAQQDLTCTTTVNDGNWHHVRMNRIGTALKLWIDGVSEASATNSYNINTLGNTLYINRFSFAIRPWIGRSDDHRITKGQGRDSSNFTPPAAEFPNF